jgi:hypothetical protein
MTTYNPTNEAQVLMALGQIDDSVVVEGLPLPMLPGVRTVGDLRKAAVQIVQHELRLIVEPYDPTGLVVRVERKR